MKVTFLITWADELGGTEQAVLTQARHLATAGHETEVLSVFRTKTEAFFAADERVPVRYLVDRTGPYPRPLREAHLTEHDCRALAALRSTLIDPLWEPAFDALSDIELDLALRELDTDVIVTASPALMSAVADLAPSRVLKVHQEHRPSQHRGNTGLPLLARAPEMDAVVVLTDWTKAWFAESLGTAAPRLEAIPNAIPEGFRPRSSRTSKTIVVPRRLVADKQVDHAIIAFGKLAVDFPDWKLRIFGEGPLLGRMRRLTGELGLHNSVEIMGASRHITDEWAKAAFTLLPSETEGFGLVLVEAFAAGVPAVAYDVPTGPAEIIRHGVDGLLVPAADTEALAAAMRRLMEDEALLHRLGENALQGAERFAAQRVNARWESLFEELYASREQPERMTSRADRAARRKAATGGGGFQPQAPASKISPSAGEQAEREQELLPLNDRLVISAGQLAEFREDLLAADAYDLNLRLAAGALERAGVPYVLLRDRENSAQHRLAVEAALRPEACAALAAAHPGEAVYAELLQPAHDAPGAVLAERLPAIGEVRGLRVYRPYLSRTRTLRYGPAFGCDIEFWQPGETEGFLAPRRQSALGPALPTLTPNAVMRIRERDYPTLEEFNDPLITDLDFPIDAVYTWVDDSDPDWQHRLNAKRAALGLPPRTALSGDAEARFRNRDELRYSLRSLAMYAPWIRTIHLVTDDQTPSWLAAEHPGLEIVPHRAIFEDPSALPVFNSHAIESRLHRIEGLAEHFLYLNDDFFLGRSLTPSRFFRSNGNTHFFWSPTAIPPGEAAETDEAYFAAAKNNRRLLKDRFNITVTHGFAHAPYPLRRSVLERITEEFAEPLSRTTRSALRDWRDISLVSSLHHHYGYLTGTAQPSALRVGYVDTGRYADQAQLTRLLASRAKDVFCLGEGPDAEVPPEEQAQVMRAFLEAYFPVRGPYEREAEPQL